jgi:hypothetical protein
MVLGLMGVRARDDFDQGGQTDRSLHDRAIALRTATNFAWVAAAVSGAAGLVLVVATPRGRTPTSSFVLGPGSAAFRATF